jgi:hypothetical protein
MEENMTGAITAPKEQRHGHHPAPKRANDDSKSKPEEQRQTFLKRHSSDWNRLVLDTWFSEILALIFSGACLLAIIAILRSYEREHVPNLSVGLSLNIFVASETIGQWKWIWFKRGSRRLQVSKLLMAPVAVRGERFCYYSTALVGVLLLLERSSLSLL